jgi:hypothetical protein
MFLTFTTGLGRLVDIRGDIRLVWIVAEFSKVIRSFLPKPPQVMAIFPID